MKDAPERHPLVEIRASAIHGTGGFARTALRKGRRIIEYRGRPLDPDEAARELQEGNRFVFSVEDDIDLDGDVEWNPARFLNHSCGPNCEARIVRGRVWIYALRSIRQGEELTYNYGHDLEDWEDRPCCCGSPSCIGYMVAQEHFAKVKRLA